MTSYKIEIDENFVNRRQEQLDGFVKPIEEIIYDAIDFYLFNRPSDRGYIKVEKTETKGI